MKRFKQIFGVVLALCLVVTQFPTGGGKSAKAGTETKKEIVSSKISFTYEETGSSASSFKYKDKEVAGFNGKGEYEIEDAGTYTAAGYTELGIFASDAEYTLKNVVLTINGKYEFVLKDTGYCWNDGGVYKLDLGNIYYEAEKISYTSKDGKATLKYDADANLVVLLVIEDGNSPAPEETKTDIISSKLTFTYEETGSSASSFKYKDKEVAGFNGKGEYEIEDAGTYTAAGYTELGIFASDAEYTLKNVVLTINGKYEFVLKDTGYCWNDGGVYKLDLGNIYYEAEKISYTSKDGKATLKYDGSLISLFALADGSGDQNPGGDDTQKPEKVKTELTSVKLSFTYEKAAEGTATVLKVCNADAGGFAGDGTYEVDIAEEAWLTWDKTGFYDLGFVESDAGYTLKNVMLTVNGVHEFILGETLASEFKDEKHKVDFPNCWSPDYAAGDVLFTSKDGKATIVFGGNNVVLSLYVESDKAPTPTKKPNRPYYPVIVSTPTPTVEPTVEPTAIPTATPTVTPTTAPTAIPTVKPTVAPTIVPTAAPTIAPTVEPTEAPTEAPAEKPTEAPATPTKAPAEKVQKGDKVTVSGEKYVVTNTSKKTVEYVAAKNSKKKTVSVPETVKVSVNGKKVTYKVTSIKNSAFKNNKKVEKITVGKNIKTIGKDAFKNCKNLKTIVIKSTSLTKIGKDALKGTVKKLVIKVPAKKVSAYKKLFKKKGNNNIAIKKA